MSLRFLLEAAALAVIAVVFSMHGQGGGVLYASLLLWLGAPFHDAAALSQFLIVVTSLSASWVFRSANKVDWAVALTLETAALSGGFIGGAASQLFNERALEAALAVSVFIAGCMMFKDLEASDPPPASKWRWYRNLDGRPYSVNIALGMPAALLIGILSGLSGTAGGFLKVPMFILLFRMPSDIALGSTQFMTIFTALGGFAGHLSHRTFVWGRALALGAFVFVGAQIGPRLSFRMGTEGIRKRFGWFLIAVSLVICVRMALTA